MGFVVDHVAESLLFCAEKPPVPDSKPGSGARFSEVVADAAEAVASASAAKIPKKEMNLLDNDIEAPRLRTPVDQSLYFTSPV